MAIVEKPKYPNVPLVTGVPPVLRAPGAAVTALALFGILQTIALNRLTKNLQWGLYTSKGLLVAADSVVEMEYHKENRVSDFPVIDGSFASYNKVQMPYMPTLRLTKGGTEADRRAFLSAIDAACDGLTLYSVVTPEKVYTDVTLESYDYSRRSSDSVTLLIVDVKLRAVRQTKPAYTTAKPITEPKNATAVTQVNTGQVQPKAPANESILSKIFGSKAGSK